MRRWRILQWASRPETTADVEFTCLRCGRDALLAVHGVALAQCDTGLVFDIGGHAMPEQIECPYCRKQLELEPNSVPQVAP